MKDDPEHNLSIRLWGFEASAKGIVGIIAVVVMFGGFLAVTFYH